MTPSKAAHAQAVLDHLQEKKKALSPSGIMPLRGALCVFCEHWTIEVDGPYSPLTPGSGFETSCLKGKWRLGRDINAEEYRKKILTGLTCPEFEKAEDKKHEG